MSMVPLQRFFPIFTLAFSDGPITGPVGIPACPEGWTRSGGSCFKYFRDHYNFDAAAEACRALDARATLATIVDDEQNLAVAKLVTGTGDAWIGRQLVNGNEIWKSGSTSSYSPGWELPLDDPNACGRIFADEHQIFPRWGRWNCELTRAVMCGFSTGGASSEDSAETTSVGPICPEGWEVSDDNICVVICPEGWTRSGGMCFKYFRDHYSWDAAAEACRALDARATLATIVDDEQNLAVAKLVTGTGDAWIGKQLVNGNEIWKSGSTSSYSPGWERPLDQNNNCGRIFADEHQIFPRWGVMNCGWSRAVMCGIGASVRPDAKGAWMWICLLLLTYYCHS